MADFGMAHFGSEDGEDSSFAIFGFRGERVEIFRKKSRPVTNEEIWKPRKP